MTPAVKKQQSETAKKLLIKQSVARKLMRHVGLIRKSVETQIQRLYLHSVDRVKYSSHIT